LADRFRAERVLGEWDSLVDRSGKVYESLPTETKPAFFELVYMLCAMQANLNRLYVAGTSASHRFQSTTLTRG